MHRRSWEIAAVASCAALLGACGDDGTNDPEPNTLPFVVVTFNTGTTEPMNDPDPEDGYTLEHAAFSDEYYGDGLAWRPAVAATRTFFDEVSPDVVVFQEIFDTADCSDIPPEAQVDFICEVWQPGDPTVAREVLGDGYQVMCHPGKSDKCAAVKLSFGAFRGCDSDYCVEGLDGYGIDGCGNGARVARGVIELAAGGTLTLVNYHGSSGLSSEDMECRARQVDQVFVDLGDGEPGANGAANLVMGDLNTDPGRFVGADPSATRWADFVGEGLGFHFITDIGEDAEPSYAGLFNIDHVMSDVVTGSCWIAGLEDHPVVIDAAYFDHLPVVCDVELPLD